MINFGSVVKYGFFNNFLYQNNGAEVGMLWNEILLFELMYSSGNRTVSRLSNSFKLFQVKTDGNSLVLDDFSSATS